MENNSTNKMILPTIALVFFAGLSFAQTEIGPSVAELKQTVLLNNQALEQAIKEYDALGFYFISKRAKSQLNLYQKDRTFNIAEFMKTPANLTVNDLSYYQYMTYRLLIKQSKWSLIYSDASQITDMLKTDALYAADYKNITVDDSGYHGEGYNPLTPTEIVDRVLKVIHEEQGVLVNGRFVKPNIKLDSLYKELELISYSYPRALSFQMIAEELYEKCALPSTGCGIWLRDAIHTRMVLKEKAESCSPINSKLKVDKLSAILSDSRNANKEMFDALYAAELGCLLSSKKDPCNKRSNH